MGIHVGLRNADNFGNISLGDDVYVEDKETE